MGKKLTQHELARTLGESQQAIARHVKLGHVKLNGDILDAVVQLYHHVKEVAAGRQPEDGSIDRMKEAALLDRVKRREIELRIAVNESELLHVDLFVDGLSAAFSACKAKLLSTPSKIRTMFPDLAPEVFGAIEQHVHDTLTELADDRFPRHIRNRLEAKSGSVQAGAAPKRKPVGRPKSKAVQRVQP